MTDGNWVFRKALCLMDEEPEDFQDRVVGILNVLRHEVYPYSDTFEIGRVCPEVKNMEQILDLDDAIAQTVLPYGLAAYLLVGEDDTMAAFFLQRYSELLREIGRRKTAGWEDVVV